MFRKRFFAWMYHRYLSDQGHPDMDSELNREVRGPLLARAYGEVLEIGAGDGANLPLYPREVSFLTLLDPNPFLLRHVPVLARQLGIGHYRTLRGVAEALDFPDNHFDTVVSTHVLCSVSDQAQALAEVKRVLRPGGLFLFLEHVAHRRPSAAFRVQQLINPFWKAVGDGCHLTRDTGAAIQEAGFREVELRSYEAEAPRFVSPHVVGSARA